MDYAALPHQPRKLHTNTAGSLESFVPTAVCRSVSWVRLTDGSILVVDGTVFTADRRVSGRVRPAEHTWSLVIRGVTPGDAGRYECQVAKQW